MGVGSRTQQKLLQAGQSAPAIADLPAGRPVVLVFFKVSCPVCQFTLPFLERLYRSGVTLCGVSQDNAADTAEFAGEFGITFPLLLDTDPFRASNDYGIAHVPSIFLIEPGGQLAMAWDGFSKPAMEALGQRFSAPVFRPDERVPAWKPG